MSRRDQIRKWMEDEAGRTLERTGVDIFDLLMMSFGRVVAREVERMPDAAALGYGGNELSHIIDWLVSAKLRNDEWLSRLDAHGRPRKLMKFGSVAQMVAEANKAMAKRRNDGASLNAAEGTELVHDCGDGYGVFRLTTKEALDHEGWQMGHCVGQGAYDSAVENGRTSIYSLRDSFGKSHATIEIDTLRWGVQQIKGKQNEHPKPEYTRRLIGWLDPSLAIEESELPPGFAKDDLKGLVELAAMKPGDVFTGSFKFRCVEEESDEFHLPLPEGIVVNGNIEVVGADLLERMKRGKGDVFGVLQSLVLPKGLKVEGSLSLNYLRLHADEIEATSLQTRICEVTKLPRRIDAECKFSRTVFDDVGDVVFKSRVNFFDCVDVRLENGVCFEAPVSVGDSRKLGIYSNPAVNFADGTVFQGGLHVTRSDVGFKGSIACKGDVRLHYSHDIMMPDSLTVEGSLYILDVVMDRWPPHLDVAGELGAAEYNVASGDVQVPAALKYG